MVSLNEHNCLRCSYAIYDSVYKYSSKNMGFPLCKNCQKWYKEEDKDGTPESKMMYLALSKRGVNVIIEKHDGHKHIDLAITGKGLKLNIEVDGSQHYTCPKQSWSDVQRTFHSLLKGFYTLRLPNILVREKLEETADLVVELLKHFKEKQAKEFEQHKRQVQLLTQLDNVTKKLTKIPIWKT